MTDFFEVHDRDGAARRGELRLAAPLTTPALVDDHVVDAGSRWSTKRPVPDGDPSTLTVLPHRAFPAGTRSEVQTAFADDLPEVDAPTAAVVTPETAARVGSGVDVAVLSTAPGVVGHGAAFVEAVVETKRELAPDVALYLPGVATPRNVATLAYAGVDLFDAKRVRVQGQQGRYLTAEGEYRRSELDDLGERPGAFPSDPPLPELDRDAIQSHNEAALDAELSTVRARIRQGRLRDYVEGQARHDQWLTATLRELDDEWEYLEQRAPVARAAELAATTEDTLRRVEIRRFADRVTSRYRPRFDDHPLVLLPCSARKPYSTSQSHRQFRDAIDYRGHVVVLTSPVGVVPQELEVTYPAQHYDAAVTGRWTDGEVGFVSEVLSRYLDRADYDRIVAHVPADYRPVVERAVEGRSLPVEWPVSDHPTTDDSLAALAATLDGAPRYRKRTRQIRTLRAVADYQFGAGAGERLLPDECSIDGVHPKLVARIDGDQVAALVPRYGTLAFTLDGARRALDAGVALEVDIDEFVPRGSVLAPGVVDADTGIRPGDEVVVTGPDALAVGRAAMSGPEMAASTRGIAVEVRHATER